MKITTMMKWMKDLMKKCINKYTSSDIYTKIILTTSIILSIMMFI